MLTVINQSEELDLSIVPRYKVESYRYLVLRTPVARFDCEQSTQSTVSRSTQSTIGLKIPVDHISCDQSTQLMVVINRRDR